jgi:hypothetical protein
MEEKQEIYASRGIKEKGLRLTLGSLIDSSMFLGESWAVY